MHEEIQGKETIFQSISTKLVAISNAQMSWQCRCTRLLNKRIKDARLNSRREYV